MMEVRIERVKEDSRQILERLLQLHLYERGMEPGPDGLVNWGEPLDPFFSDPHFLALFVASGQDTIGFTLAKLDYALLDPVTGDKIRVNFIEEYYLLRPHRRKGIGTKAIDLILTAHPGVWFVTTWPDQPAVQFWRHLAVGRHGAGGREFPPEEHEGFPGQFMWIIAPCRSDEEQNIAEQRSQPDCQ